MKRLAVVLLALVATVGAGSRGGAPEHVGLQDFARRRHRHLLLGAAANVPALSGDARYRHVLAREYGMLTPENELKWDTIHPSRHRYDFGPGDRLVRFARRHRMRVHGHTLAWWFQNPAWLTEGTYTRAQLVDILHDHIRTVVGHYRGQVELWDVVNEGVTTSGLRDNVWLRGIGPEYIDLAFRWAHEADPAAKLFYNDFGAEGRGAKSDAVYRMVAGLRSRGVPVDGVGLQLHTLFGTPPAADLAWNMNRLRRLGLEVAITELDVALPLPADQVALRGQAEVYADVLRTCLDAANCRTFTTWGFTDRYSWIPSFFHGFGAALPFDEQYRPKPAYRALRTELARARTAQDARRGS